VKRVSSLVPISSGCDTPTLIVDQLASLSPKKTVQSSKTPIFTKAQKRRPVAPSIMATPKLEPTLLPAALEPGQPANILPTSGTATGVIYLLPQGISIQSQSGLTTQSMNNHVATQPTQTALYTMTNGSTHQMPSVLPLAISNQVVMPQGVQTKQQESSQTEPSSSDANTPSPQPNSRALSAKEVRFYFVLLSHLAILFSGSCDPEACAEVIGARNYMRYSYSSPA